MKRPNILFILTDQQMAGSLGAYGNTICQTPNLDALARQGTRFDRAYTVCPICTPSRASLQTGLFPFRHGMQSNIYTRGCMVHELPDNPRLLSRQLQRAGYQTGFTGKWHLGFGDARAEHPEYKHHIRQTPLLDLAAGAGTVPSTVGYRGDDFPGHGGIGMDTPQYRGYLERRNLKLQTRSVHTAYPEIFEVLSGTESTVSHFLMERAMETLEDFLERDEPFYYQLNFWGPHAPYHASTEFLDRYRDLPIPEWPSFREDLTHKPNIHNAHRTETTADWTWEAYQTLLRMYYASITELDDKIGRLVQFLKEHRIFDNTLILFSSDHGDSAGVHRGLTDKSLFMYEETNRIPLIVTSPRDGSLPPPSESRFVQTCDLYSTILHAAGVPRAEAELDGRSLLPLLNGSAENWRDCVVTEASGIDFLLFTQRALRWGDLKYVFNCAGTDELYDLAADPHEIQNLAPLPEHRLTLLDMRRRLERWLDEQGDGLVERYRRLRILH